MEAAQIKYKTERFFKYSPNLCVKSKTYHECEI